MGQRTKKINKPNGMVLVGLTGGLASGKTQVAGLLRAKGFVVVSMDALAKSLYTKDSPIYQRLVQEFGPTILDASQGIDTKKLAALVFQDPKQVKRLNDIVHPAVFQKLSKELRRLHEQGVRLVIVESAILRTSGLADSMDKVVEVTAEEGIRLDRAVRRGMSLTDARSRIRLQAMQGSGDYDYLLENNSDMDDLRLKVEHLETFLNEIMGENNGKKG